MTIAPTQPIRGLPQRDASTRLPLVATKLEPPPLPPTYTTRARLTDLLSRGSAESSRLTLVSAPPGYGKTIAVRGWMATQDRPFAWLTLDEGDDDPVRLVRYLVAALGSVRPGIGQSTTTLLGVSGLPSAELVAATLLDEIASSAEPFVLVIDDHQALPRGLAQQVVARLIAQAPPFAQIVLATRQDPDLPLARLRASGRLVEVRAEDLRLTAAEAATLLTSLGVGLDQASVDLITERTEGWAAGLQLAALTLRGRSDVARAIADFGATHRYLVDYLGDEVMARQPNDLRSFLERTSVADRLCPGLAAALTGRVDAGDMLAEVRRRNLFLLPLDVGGSWTRYHHLFADYLRSRLSPDERAALQLAAAAWCSAEGLALEAGRYALESGKWPEALPYVADGSHAALALGEPGTVLRWTDAVPPRILDSSPDLLADRAWAAFIVGAMPVVATTTDRLAELDTDGLIPGRAAGRARGIRSWLAVLGGQPEEGERLGRLAVASLDDDPLFRGLALLALGDACWDLGRPHESAAAVDEALAIARTLPPTVSTYLAAYVYAVGCNEQGRRREAERECREMLAAATDPAGRILQAAGTLRVGLGMLAYEGNDLATAATELEAGFEMSRRLGTERLLGGESRRARAMTRLATAGPESAARAAREAVEAGPMFLPRTRAPAAEALTALLALRAGDRRRALAWAELVLAGSRRQEPATPKVRLHRDLAVASILVAAHDARAGRVALEAARSAVAFGSILGQIQAAILEGCAAEQAGRREDARSHLAHAIILAAPGHYVRRFVEDAGPVAHLLPTVRSLDATFVDGVIDALTAEDVRMTPGRSASGAVWRAEDGALLELLTQRELDVLRLVARGQSNAGIGEALGVSVGTAKWHVANVLAKLGTASRTQAAMRARDVGLV